MCQPYRKLRQNQAIKGLTKVSRRKDKRGRWTLGLLILCVMKGFLLLAVSSDPLTNWLCCGFIVWPFLVGIAKGTRQVTIQPDNEEKIEPVKQKL